MQARLDFAVNEKYLIFREAGDQKLWRSIPKQIDAAGFILQNRKQYLAASAWDVLAVQPDQPADEARVLAAYGAGDFLDLAAVFIAKRQMVEQIADRFEAQGCQLGGAFGTDAAQKLDRRL